MGWFLAGIAWLVASWLAFVYVTVPLALAAVVLGLPVGAALAAVGYLLVYAGKEDGRALALPAHTPPGAPAAPTRRRRAPYPRWDACWPSYLSWQIERDAAAATVWPSRMLTNMWRWAGTWAGDHQQLVLVGVALAPVPAGFLVGVTAGAGAAWVTFAVAAEAATAVPRLVRLAAIGFLRVIDASVRWLRGAAGMCPRCRWLTRLPAYPCPRCGELQRDVRPGRLGAWCHRCQCGAPIPTTVLRAGRALPPACPSCGHPLHERAGCVQNARIALSGGPAAGKTQLLMQAAARMTDCSTSPGRWEPADDYSADWLAGTGRLIGRSPRRGQADAADPTLLTFRSHAGGRRHYLHIADVRGDHFLTDANDAALWHLGVTRRHLLVLDPTVIPSVRDRIDPATLAREDAHGGKSPLAGAGTSTAVAELPYHILVTQLERLGARTRRCSLAVVVVKANLLASHGMAAELDSPRGGSHGLRKWLCDMGLHNLVESAEHDFQQVQYFLMEVATDPDPAAPFAWLLSRYPQGHGTP